MASPPGTGVAILGLPDLAALRGDWDALADRCPEHYLSQTWGWATTAWHTVAAPRGRTLHILTMRSEGRLVAVWPLVTYRDEGLRMIRQLGAEGSEYVSPLVEPGPDVGQRMASLVRAASTLGADVLFLPHVLRGGLFSTLLERHRIRAFEYDISPTPWIARRDYREWSDYVATLSPSHRARLRNRRRRLDKQGKLSFGVERSPIDATDIDRMLLLKLRWIDQRRVFNGWIGTPEYRAFLLAKTSAASGRDDLTFFTLRLDGRLIAAQLNAVGPTRVEFMIGVFDEHWTRDSPGEVLMEECVRWAFDNGLDFDFRIGDEPYKFRWARRDTISSAWRVALSLRGLIALGVWRLRLKARRLGLGRLVRPWRHAVVAPRNQQG